jgi:signal peptidase I
MKPRKTEHPILFSTPMVQAILALIKTMTRRIKGLEKINENPNEWIIIHKNVLDINNIVHFHFYNPTLQESKFIKCPYGQPGDKLWVRETFVPIVIQDHDGNGNDKYTWIYKADEFDRDILDNLEDSTWKPSIHMPKAAARVWLMITDVRVERLQDISQEDAKAEGVEKWVQMSSYRYKDYTGNVVGFWENINPVGCMAAIASFNSLWIKINGMDSFKSNPWVWVIEFKRIEPCQ